jgi:hypothetical protein
MRSSLPLFMLVCCLAVLAVQPAAATPVCASGTVTAVYNADPAFPGMWKYCAEVSWCFDKYGVSHLDAFLRLPSCDCICDPRFIQFGSPAGHAVNTSVVPNCELDYSGTYACKGDPSLPAQYNGPAVKFQPITCGTCEAGTCGYGTFCFYSPMPPQAPADDPQGIAIKHGQEICYGVLSGQMPSCDCALPTQTATWGSLKASYR